MEYLNWYPGHMKKTGDMIRSNLKMVDAVIEVIDGRIPFSSRNPDILELCSGKIHIIALNKSDLSDEKAQTEWISYFREQGIHAFQINAVSGSGIGPLLKCLGFHEKKINEGRRRFRPLRIMVVGVPNVGKSSLINRMAGGRKTMIGNRPGVTRGKQWLSLENGMQLLDTPGMLWPKFEDKKIGLYLAFCGCIRDEILDIPGLALELIKVLIVKNKRALVSRYNLEDFGESPLGIMDMIAANRGFLLRGGRIDYERTGFMLLDEYRSGKIGRITLEEVEDCKK